MGLKRRGVRNSSHSLILVSLPLSDNEWEIDLGCLDPIIDLTDEIPYEKLNSLQNPNVYHGQCVYMKGVTQLEYSPEITKKVFEKMCEISSKDMRLAVLFELYPLGKINSVSNDSTAFNIRGPANNVLCMSLWDDNTPENGKVGKSNVYSITDIISMAEQKPEVSQDRAYGNYGKSQYHLKADNILIYDSIVGDDTLVDNDRAKKVFGSNYPRLQAIKKKYDPEVLFSKWFAILPQAA